MADDDKRRFATLSEIDLNQLIKDKDSKNTKKVTAFAVKTFRAYLSEKGLEAEFETFDVEQLDKVLTSFYAEVRAENGELYKRTSLQSIRHGLNRFLQTKRGEPIDIINDKVFSKSKQSFLAATKELKKQGKGGIEHYPYIESADLYKMYKCFDTDNPEKLQEKVFVDIALYFGRRGRENFHELKITDFAARADGDGEIYIYMPNDELTKNHQDDTNTADGRMYKCLGDPLCPVTSFMKYKRQLNPGLDRLFQRPSKRSAVHSYDKVPLGHNTIGKMMPNISERAGLSARYTNHSLRATSVHLLDSSGEFAGRHIITVTGHKSESSLKTYSGKTDLKIKRKMSETISSKLRESIPQQTVGTHSVHSDNNVMPILDVDIENFELKPLSDSQLDEVLQEFENDNDIDNYFQNIDIEENVANDINKNANVKSASVNDNCSKAVIQSMPFMNQINMMNINAHQMPFPSIQNCSNVTINFNFQK